MKVLIVEDDPVTSLVLSRILTDRGYDVTVCATAEEAMKVCQQTVFPLFFLDLFLPGMDGFSFAEAMRDDPRTADLPIIALSSLTSPEAIERGRQVGFQDYIAKFDRDALLNTLSATLSMHRSVV